MPGKSLISLAAKSVGMNTHDYRTLVNEALGGADGLRPLGEKLAAALEALLPPRSAPVAPKDSNLAAQED